MMQTQLSAKINAAKERRDNDLNSFIWKGGKVEVNGEFVQQTYRLMDCTIEQLQGFYDHCETMLTNTSKDTPGRKVVLNLIEDQITRCNVELFLRWLNEEPRNIPRFIFMNKVRELLDNNPHISPSELPMSKFVGGCPQEFANITANFIIDGCLDKLGKFDRKHITLTFILKQGIWFTDSEKKELDEYREKNGLADRDEAARLYLGLKPLTEEEKKNPRIGLVIYRNPKGLSLAQMRAMVKLTSTKYSALTTIQLNTLRDRMLFALEDEIKYHIKQWETRKSQIIKVAKAKGFDLKTNN